GFIESIEQRAFQTLTSGARELRGQPFARGIFELVERFKPERLGEVVIDLSRFRSFDFRCSGLELRWLTSQLLVCVVFGETDLKCPGFVDTDANQLVLESRNKLARPDHHPYVFAGAAIERRAVDRPLEVNGDAIAGLGLGVVALLGIAA